MRKVLLTGASGFIGRNIVPIMNKSCELYTPSRSQLDLKNYEEVRDYLRNNRFDVIIHSANPNPVKNVLDKNDTMFEDGMRCFMNLYQSSAYCSQLFYLGSGAEYDKRYDISLVSEEKIGYHIPGDGYGFAKYIMNILAEKSNNVYNLRIFGCYGPTDHSSKFITHAINCCKEKKPITIRQNCLFDYMQVSDIGKILCRLFDADLQYHDYNVCTGRRESLLDIAQKVKDQMNSDCEIQILSKGMNKEYTANNSRLLEAIGGYSFITLDDGIKIQIESMK